MEEITFLIEEDKEDGGYVARALEEAIFTQGETLQEIKENIKDALICHFDEEIPKKVILKIVKEELLSV